MHFSRTHLFTLLVVYGCCLLSLSEGAMVNFQIGGAVATTRPTTPRRTTTIRQMTTTKAKVRICRQQQREPEMPRRKSSLRETAESVFFGRVVGRNIDSWNWVGTKYEIESAMPHKMLISNGGIDYFHLLLTAAILFAFRKCLDK
jgi:hypothetical protein